MWNRKRWMRYSMRLHRNMPSMKSPGNTDSGTATEYSAGVPKGRQGQARVAGGQVPGSLPLLGERGTALCPAPVVRGVYVGASLGVGVGL